MNDMNDINEYKTQNEEREALLNVIREQISNDEQRIRELDASIKEIRRDIGVLKKMIEYLRGIKP